MTRTLKKWLVLGYKKCNPLRRSAQRSQHIFPEAHQQADNFKNNHDLQHKPGIVLAALASEAASLSTRIETAETTSLYLSPFMDLSLALQPPTFTSDYSGKVGLFQQVGPPGNLSGKLNGTVPVAGNFELDFPSAAGSTEGVSATSDK